MLIFYVPSYFNSVNPIVVIDYTRSDDQYNQAQIISYVASLGVQAARGKPINMSFLTIYSLDYSMSFTHSGNNYGDSLKTKFTATIQNAPTDLIGLLNVKQYVGEENVDVLKGALSNIIDPQVFFPTGAFVIKQNSNTAATRATTISRTFMIYDTPYNFDPRRINSTLVLHGSEFDSMVMRLQFAVNLSKTKGTLVSQLSTIFAKQQFTITADAKASTLRPKVARYYRPAPMNKILNEICRDNGIIFKIDSSLQTVKLQSIGGVPPVPSEPLPNSLCFNNYVPDTKLISTFSLQNYVICNFESEAFDISLFDTVIVYDDSLSSNPLNPMANGIFANLKQSPAKYQVGRATILSYTFYVLEYTYIDSRTRTSVAIRGTNNWLISNFKLGTFLENKIYLAPQLPPGVPVQGSPV